MVMPFYTVHSVENGFPVMPYYLIFAVFIGFYSHGLVLVDYTNSKRLGKGLMSCRKTKEATQEDGEQVVEEMHVVKIKCLLLGKGGGCFCGLERLN